MRTNRRMRAAWKRNNLISSEHRPRNPGRRPPPCGPPCCRTRKLATPGRGTPWLTGWRGIAIEVWHVAQKGGINGKSNQGVSVWDRKLRNGPGGGVGVEIRPRVTVRSGRDGLDPDDVGGACNHRRSVSSVRCAFPGRRKDSTAWPNGYVRECIVSSNRFLFGKRDTMRESQRADPHQVCYN